MKSESVFFFFQKNQLYLMVIGTCVLRKIWGQHITHLPSLLLPHGRCCPPVKVTPSWKRECSGSHRAPYEVASVFTTYVKTNKVVLVPNL